MTDFTRLMIIGNSKNDCMINVLYIDTEFMEYIVTLSPSNIDFDIRSLGYTNDFEDLKIFINAMKFCMLKRSDFDMIQAMMSVFLKV